MFPWRNAAMCITSPSVIPPFGQRTYAVDWNQYMDHYDQYFVFHLEMFRELGFSIPLIRLCFFVVFFLNMVMALIKESTVMGIIGRRRISPPRINKWLHPCKPVGYIYSSMSYAQWRFNNPPPPPPPPFKLCYWRGMTSYRNKWTLSLVHILI